MQPIYDTFKYLPIEVEFVEGLVDVTKFDGKINSLLLIDDLMELCKESKEI